MLYDVNYLTRPTGNAFAGDIKGMDSKRYSGSGAAGSQADAYEKLRTLDEGEYFMAYVTLSRVMSYEEFKEWFDALELPVGGVWCVVPEQMAEFAQNIEECGLYTYGFAVQAQPDVLITLSEQDEVCYIYTTPIQ